MELNGTTAIVSGGASGLGEATARELAKAGALVIVADLAADRGETVAADIGGVFAARRGQLRGRCLGRTDRRAGRDTARSGRLPEGHRGQPDRHL
jgi:NAD(P)-dependent dehydrogenase (short-subunit alcohol dehydrogenase family)